MNARWAWLTGLLLASAASAEAAPVKLSGRVLAASGKYVVHIALWRSDGFLVRPAVQIRITPGTTMQFKFEVAPGHWALSAFEFFFAHGQDRGRHVRSRTANPTFLLCPNPTFVFCSYT